MKRTARQADLMDAVRKSIRTESEEVRVFRRCYRAESLPDYVSFDNDTADNGIPGLIRLFRRFDPVNNVGEHPIFTSYRKACLSDVYHVLEYLRAPEFNAELLRTRRYDAVVHAIVSFVLHWKNEYIQRFRDNYPEFSGIVARIMEEKNRDYGIYVFNVNGVPFVRTAFRIIRDHFEPAKPDLDELLFSTTTTTTTATTTTTTTLHSNNTPFQLLNHLDPSFIRHLRHVYRGLRDRSLTVDDISTIESDMPIPYDLQATIGDYEEAKRRATVKFITGQACCGKTTLLNSLKAKGWTIVSRGSVGSFAGKASSPVAVACLHASIEWSLGHSNVLGDRSAIDNPLWVAIMELCNPVYEETLVDELLKFVNANFNEPALGYFIGQRGVIFVDPLPDACARRMLNRSTGGDAHRGRIDKYAIVQSMAYYTVARLFGWRVYCVPYTVNRNTIDSSRYLSISRELDDYFGRASIDRPLPVSRYSRPVNNYPINNKFAKSIGIYK